MKYEIKNRWTGNVQFTADIECHESTETSIKIGLSIKWGLSNGSDLRSANLRGADLRGADLSDADLSGAYLSGADLSGAYLSDADLSGAYLSGADLSGAYLRGAYLSDAYLRGADLSGAYLRDSNLRGADLSDAYLRGADLSGAYLRGAYLRDGQKLTGDRPVLQIGPIGSRGDTLMVFMTDKGTYAKTGCFFGTLDEFLEAVKDTHGDGVHAKEYIAAIEFARFHEKLWGENKNA